MMKSTYTHILSFKKRKTKQKTTRFQRCKRIKNEKKANCCKVLLTRLIAKPVNHELLDLLKICGQQTILPLESIIIDSEVTKKLGEGSYSEVFIKQCDGVTTVLKIIPFGGDKQTSGKDILSEIRITKTVSDWGASQATSCVVRAKKFTVASGCFTKHLINIWEKWKEEECTESRHPHPICYKRNQLYMVLEFEYGGEVLKNVQLKNQQEVLSVIKQVIFILAVMERDLGFEHRDLHLSNVLLHRVKSNNIDITNNNNNNNNKNKNNEEQDQLSVQLIDFSFARCVSTNNFGGKKEVLYKDLSNEAWLFEGTGHEQFTICRQMRHILDNSWRRFNPKTNVIWVLYLFKNLLKQLRYTKKLRIIFNSLKECQSCNDMWKIL